MPTYDYKCLACTTQFEEFQSITAPAIEECPECGGKVKRLIGAGAGLIFKGSGFYITDYRSEGYKESAKKAEGTSSDKSEKKEKQDKTASSDAKSTSADSKGKSTDSE